MTTEALKTTLITNLDATPPVRATAGKGGQGLLQTIYGTVTPTNGVTTGSTYRMARVPSNCSVKHVLVDFTGTITTFTADVTVYYSDLAIDETGASTGNSGVVNSLSTTAALFAHTYGWGGTVNPTDITDQNSAYPPSARNKELWDACGLSTDPGGFFDITIVMVATANISAAVIGMEVQFTEPYV